MSLLRQHLRAASRIIRVSVCVVAAWTCIATAQTPSTTEKPTDKPPAPAAQAKPEQMQPPLPADAHVEQSIQLDGKALKYTATVGTLPVYGRDGKKSADVVFTSYTMDGR